jgi:hypothetical protein
MIALGTFLVALGVIGVLIACGIAFNLHLYSQGAFGRRRFNRPPSLETAFAGPDASFHRGTSAVDRGMTHYARRVAVAIFSIVIVLIMLVALLISTALH